MRGRNGRNHAATRNVSRSGLGHNRKAVHRAYAKRALMKIPSLEEYEREAAAKVEPATQPILILGGMVMQILPLNATDHI